MEGQPYTLNVTYPTNPSLYRLLPLECSCGNVASYPLSYARFLSGTSTKHNILIENVATIKLLTVILRMWARYCFHALCNFSITRVTCAAVTYAYVLIPVT